MTHVVVQIVRYVDAAQPGWVECTLMDAWGRTWTFVDKVPVFTAAFLDAAGPYPRPGVIACRVVRRWRDPAGRDVVTVDTRHPYAVASTDGRTCFDVLPQQLAEPADDA